ncbi:hypothetical protein [Gilliamella sp. BG6]|uniref:hypothetical protein n=1 Tax=unclassified Gilliamella TaxID=2685620 RepID=UPI003988626A
MINWRDASKESPENDGGIGSKLCFVVIQFKNSLGELCRTICYDWYDNNKNEWDIHHDEITHWIYADEIPLPEE